MIPVIGKQIAFFSLAVLFASWILPLRTSATAQPTILYVSDTTGADTTGDGSQSNPFATITKAIQTANGSEGATAEIRVASGTYTFTKEGGTIFMDDWESLYGGYAPDFSTRDRNLYQTIIDMQRVSTILVASNNTTIDGFILQNGYGSTTGGVYLTEKASFAFSSTLTLSHFTP